MHSAIASGLRRERRAVALCLLVANLAACSGKDGSDDERRRALLRPPDPALARAAEREKARLADDEGALLPSDKVFAGITLPRGFAGVLALEHERYYRSAYVSLAQLDRYFSGRLAAQAVERSPHTIRFVAAREKENPKAIPVTVRIGVAPGVPGTHEIYIAEPPPGPAVRPSEAEVNAQMEARRKFAL
jgi:hypothetical protein